MQPKGADASDSRAWTDEADVDAQHAGLMALLQEGPLQCG